MSSQSSLILSAILIDNSRIIINCLGVAIILILQLIKVANVIVQIDRKILLNFIEQSNKQGKQNLYLLYNNPFTAKQDFYVIINFPELIILCDCCQRKLNLSSSVLLVYSQSQKDYCLTCFLKLDLTGQSYHYFIRPNLNVTITEQGWNLLSELLLINGLQRYGFGSWEKVKNYLDYHGHNFSSEQIETHFMTYYMSNNLQPIFTKHFKENNVANPYCHQPPTQNIQQKEEQGEIKIRAYNPKRDQHLFDYDKQAQLFVCDLQFSPQDSPEQTELKLCKLEEYDKRILQREKREKLAIEHKLLQDQYQRKLLSSSLTKNSIRKQLQPFTRFTSHQQFEKMVSYLTLQSSLKGVVRELSSERKKMEKPTFEKVYHSLLVKRQQLRNRGDRDHSPAQLNIIRMPAGQKDELRKREALNYAQAVKRIKEVEFVSPDSDITVISWAK